MESDFVAQARRQDCLVRRPTKRVCYINDDGGAATFDNRFNYGSFQRTRAHPKVTAAKRNRTFSKKVDRWFRGIDPGLNVPIAGISKDAREEDLRIKLLQPKLPRKTKGQRGRALKANPDTSKDSPQTELQTNAGVSIDRFAVSASQITTQPSSGEVSPSYVI